MSATEAAPRKKRTTENAKRTPEDDHRRKRRNRTTQSCLNCHTSKRMCDRKRPCGRCTQLGLTGLCVYEVDDPNQRHDNVDEKTRLQKRVAELESVIRELKNKPHPRWAQTGKNEGTQKSSKSNSPSPSRYPSEDAPPSPSGPVVHLHPPTAPSSCRASPIDTTMSGSSSSSYSSPSPLGTPSPLALTPIDIAGDSAYDFASLLSTCYPEGAGLDGALDSIFDGLMHSEGLDRLAGADSCSGGHASGHCGCLSDTSSYNVVLELSLRLRRAAETLGHFPKHRTHPDCPIHQRIAELDRCTTEALGSVNSSASALSPYANSSHAGLSASSGAPFPLHLHQMDSCAPILSGTISPQSLHAAVRPSWAASSPYPTPPSEDTFMSWEPHRRPAEWSP
ncbi:hypothetical protein NM688_g3290 [Phlebia brevispora]|uniref:Uncharacterized protein n=1 Tax=Phlebia brevispora TaxID=194682 RepID=A0ACC1T683_9APHY|nr:hypothetical protein NM688_g3290 [Phlebia brevispora]